MTVAHHSATPITAAARPGFAARVARAAAGLLTLWKSRRAMRHLNDLSDWELADLGLVREDIARAYEIPLLDDPTLRLQQIARKRARSETIMRRRP
ncbi:DUF1127 domain-containing protein [Nitratireductor luteus]|uniref:DUF1127 domain-containing protein n=1 Tax=Nitratireductor luteus TaxID=2976980 RepID=UPI002240CE4D|nr:DUF1127 domain-containing protein [Nitratireductor luteus]